MQLPPNAPAWEHGAVRLLQRHCCSSPEFLDWVILIRPYRVLVLLLFLVACYAMSRLGLGPIFILGSIATLIFCNLGKRRPGEASAYSIFNPGPYSQATLQARTCTQKFLIAASSGPASIFFFTCQFAAVSSLRHCAQTLTGLLMCNQGNWAASVEAWLSCHVEQCPRSHITFLREALIPGGSMGLIKVWIRSHFYVQTCVCLLVCAVEKRYWL